MTQTKNQKPPPKSDFDLFVHIWNKLQKNKTPDLHFIMLDWLEAVHTLGIKNALLMAFRSAGKSTLVGLYAAWILYQNPDARIMVLAADHALAIKMVRNVKRIIEKHPLTRDLKPKNTDQWASDRFTIKRATELRDPSMLAKGITSNITGSRADIVICDDVEVPNTCDTPGKREDLRERLSEIPYVLVADGCTLYVGTPHHYYSIYADTPRTEIDEDRAFLEGYERLSIPLLDENGVCAWPERYPQEVIDNFIAAHGQNKFDSQMQLKPVNIMTARLDPELLHFYGGEVEHDIYYTQSLHIGHMKMVKSCAFWDPSLAKASGDDSVLAIVYIGEDDHFYLHHLEYLKVDQHAKTPPAMQQCDRVAELCAQHFIGKIDLEVTGFGHGMKDVLGESLKKIKAQTKIIQATPKKNKATRIVEAFDAVLGTGKLHVHNKIKETPFIMQMREWRPGKSSCKDDALDAIAGALTSAPHNITPYTPKGSYTWTNGHGKTHKGKSDWEV